MKTLPSPGDRGQMVIMFVLFMTVVFVIGVIVVDFALWFTERRGAQKDADSITLAGAYELLEQDFVNFLSNDNAVTAADASDAVYQWADFNDLADADVKNLNIYRDANGCFGTELNPQPPPPNILDTVEAAAQHHEGGGSGLFTAIFEQAVPQIGAPAKACLGSVNTAEGLLPVGVQIEGFESDCWEDVNGDGEEDPLFGEDCVLAVGASQTTSGEGGMLNMYDNGGNTCSGNNTGGANAWRDEIEQGGANTTCHVYKYFNDPSKYDPDDGSASCSFDPGGCVYPQTGVPSRPGMVAFNDLISKETQSGYECDENFGNLDTYDDFLEVVEPVNGDSAPAPDTVFALRDCLSPRLVSLVILDQYDVQGNSPSPIVAFAGFFIQQCESEDGTEISRRCDPQDFNGAIGQVRVRGFFVNILVTAGGVGQITKWSPKRIVLAD